MKGCRYKITGYLEIASLLRSEMLEKKRKEKKDVWKKTPIYYDVTIGIKNLSGYMKQGHSWTTLC